MMSMGEAMNSIERAELSSVLGLANNVEMFRELVGREPAVHALLTHLTEPGNSRALLTRIDSLVREQDDIRFRNDQDATIAIYLWALNSANPPLARLGASVVLVAPRLWWARKMALAIITGISVPSESAGAPSQISSVGQWKTAPKRNVREIMVLGDLPTELLQEDRVLDPSAIQSRGETNNPTAVGNPTFDTSSEADISVKKL
jgi:hypothetical protein